MTVRFFCLSLIFLAYTATAQESTELDRRNGFKDLKLGMRIDSVKGEVKFKKDFKDAGEFDAKLFSVSNPEYDQIGEVKVDRIEVKTYKDLVYEITVVADKDPRLMKALESIYGKSEYDLKAETYFWKSPTITLKFRSHSRNQLEMVYTTYVVRKMMKEDKQKKVQAIADDF